LNVCKQVDKRRKQITAAFEPDIAFVSRQLSSYISVQ